MFFSVRFVVCTIGVFGMCITALAQQKSPIKRPNIVLIIADDMNWDTPGCFGGAAPDITPNIDRLAKRVYHLEHRTAEEFYDLRKDPFCLENLLPYKDLGAAFKLSNKALEMLRQKLRTWMVEYNDFALEAFDQRDSTKALEQFMKDYIERSGKEVESMKPYEEAKCYRF